MEFPVVHHSEIKHLFGYSKEHHIATQYVYCQKRAEQSFKEVNKLTVNLW